MTVGSAVDILLSVILTGLLVGLGWSAGPRMLLYRAAACEIALFYVMCGLLGRLGEGYSLTVEAVKLGALVLYLLVGALYVDGRVLRRSD